MRSKEELEQRWKELDDKLDKLYLEINGDEFDEDQLEAANHQMDYLFAQMDIIEWVLNEE